MSNKMLIDASHPEETRVVVTRGNRIEEFDFESEHKKQLKGNIYLARVTRVEPSLQAAFIEYGGNRHGFLAFSEIHPDYYQIPVADRQALIEAQEQAARQENENGEFSAPESSRKKRAKQKDEENDTADHISDDADDEQDDSASEEPVELAGIENAMEEISAGRLQQHDYNIQEVIKRRQILLVQVIKEERGNKGAALTTYLSLAGRYSVLMPNTARGGGISRKITNASDRKRLRDVVKDLEVPKGMGVILRTAGANRTKAEVKRDYEYLIRLWDNVRNLTLSSAAPALVYEEGSLIKRSIRDLYNKDISEILVAGEKGYREAKDFMRMLMPSHAKSVQPYRDKLPIFARNGIETQLDRMLQPAVSLKSGGYLVINQAEALVAIDVNSGRSTKEHSVEETATQTNLEAAEEIARQLRLRDLAGLVVIDFIDMQDKHNIRAVEKKLKDCLKGDRARIQVGRISHFGLMEMSRQRIRASVLESTTQPCPHCSGTGYIRSESSVALHVIRAIEEYLLRNSQHNIIVRTPVNTALYVLNHKRKVLGELESRFALTIDIEADDSIGNQHLAIYKGTAVDKAQKEKEEAPALLLPEEDMPEEAGSTAEDQTRPDRNRRRRRRGGEHDGEKRQKQPEAQAEQPASETSREEDQDRKRRRRRGRRGGRRNREHDMERRLPQAEPVGPFAAAALAAVKQDRRQRALPEAEPVGFTAKAGPAPEIAAAPPALEAQAEKPAKRSRRKPKAQESEQEKAVAQKETAQPVAASPDAAIEPAKPKRTRRKKAGEAETAETAPAQKAVAAAEETEATDKKQVKKPRARRTKKTEADAAKTAPGQAEPETEKTAAETASAEPVAVSSGSDETNPDKPKRMGWWQRKGFF